MPSSDQISVIGGADGDKVVVGPDGVLEVKPAPSASDLVVVHAVYDNATGALTLVRRNGDTEVINGFPTADQVKPAKRGRKGRRGLAGRDGRDGTTGNTGPDGCEGVKGAVGADGDAGEDGEDGPDGAQGIMGRRGISGIEGYEGEEGEVGDEGVVGSAGPSCIVGKRGPAGPAPIGTCVYGPNLPTDPAVFLWVLPLDGFDRPEVPKWSDVIVYVKDRTVQAQRFQQTNMFSALFDVEATAVGGSGVYEYTWIVPDIQGIKFKPSGLRLNVDYSRRAPDSSYPGEIFTVKLVVRDIARPGKPSFFDTAEVRIKV